MRTLFTEEGLQAGDFVIATHSTGGYYLGFYLGKGSGKSYQFYRMHSLSCWIDNEDYTKPPRRDYIPEANIYSFIKYSETLITDECVLETYRKAIRALKILKIIEE